jgi:hypothetical protein
MRLMGCLQRNDLAHAVMVFICQSRSLVEEGQENPWDTGGISYFIPADLQRVANKASVLFMK